MHRNPTLNKVQDTSQVIWGELEEVCRKIHSAWYVKANKPLARRYLKRLERLLAQLPENDLAIVREEGLALLYELSGQTSDAIKHRKKEIQLMQKLHKEVKAQDYPQRLTASILVNRDTQALQKRRAILRALQRQEQ